MSSILPLKRLIDPVSPVVMPSPTGYTPATTTGTLVAGAYAYRVTALDSAGHETLPSVESTFTLSATGGITVQWFPVLGAYGYKIYGRTSGAELLLVTLTGGSQNSWSDTGANTPAGAMPSSTIFSEITSSPGLYVCPAGVNVRLDRFVVSNPNLGIGHVYLSVVPVGFSGGPANRVLAGVPCLPDSMGGPFEWATGLALSPGDFLTGYVDQPGMVLSGYGVIG